MDVDQHMVVLTRHLHEALGHLMTIDTISHAVTRSGDPFPMPKLGPGATGVSLRGHGWGRWLERVDKRILAGIDRSLDPETSAAAAIAMFQKDIDRMTAAHEAAVAAGLERPLEGEEILSTAHLVADADTLRVLIGMCGSALAARTWLTEQMAIHAMQVAAKRSTRHRPRRGVVVGRRRTRGRRAARDGPGTRRRPPVRDHRRGNAARSPDGGAGGRPGGGRRRGHARPAGARHGQDRCRPATAEVTRDECRAAMWSRDVTEIPS
jgi:hypothetical protein